MKKILVSSKEKIFVKSISLAVFISLIVVLISCKNNDTKTQTYIFSLPENAAMQVEYCIDIPEKISLRKDTFNSRNGILGYILYDNDAPNDNLLPSIYFYFPTLDQNTLKNPPPTPDEWLQQLESNPNCTDISVEEIHQGELSGFLVNMKIENNGNEQPLVVQFLTTNHEDSQQYTGIEAGFYNLNVENYDTYLHILQSIRVKSSQDDGIIVSPDMVKLP